MQPPPLPYASPSKLAKLRNPLASLSLYCACVPPCIWLLALFIVNLKPDVATGRSSLLLNFVLLLAPLAGLGAALTALLLKTQRRKTAVLGLIGCTLWLLPLMAALLCSILSPPRPATFRLAPHESAAGKPASPQSFALRPSPQSSP